MQRRGDVDLVKEFAGEIVAVTLLDVGADESMGDAKPHRFVRGFDHHQAGGELGQRGNFDVVPKRHFRFVALEPVPEGVGARQLAFQRVG